MKESFSVGEMIRSFSLQDQNSDAFDPGASSVNPRFCFDSVAGRVVLSFFGSSKHPSSKRFLIEIAGRADRFNLTNAIFFGVSIDPEDSHRLGQRSPGIMFFWDLDRAVSSLYGVIREAQPGAGDGSGGAAVFKRQAFILDRALRVLARNRLRARSRRSRHGSLRPARRLAETRHARPVPGSRGGGGPGPDRPARPVPRVTKGKRYAFLPFLYDDAAAALRERNRRFLGDLFGASGVGGRVTNVCASPGGESAPKNVVLDGSAGCGNPQGCQTCLTAPTYELGTPGTGRAGNADGAPRGG